MRRKDPISQSPSAVPSPHLRASGARRLEPPRSRCFQLLVLVDDLVVSLDDFLFGATGLAAVRRSAGLPTGRSGRLCVDLLGEPVRGLDEALHRGLDQRRVTALQGFLDLVEGGLDGGALGSVDLVTQLAQRLLGGVDNLVRAVARLGLFPALAVIVRVVLGLPRPPRTMTASAGTRPRRATARPR